MNDLPPRLTGGPGYLDRFRHRLTEANSFRRQMRLLKWLVPAVMILLVVGYELGPSRWTYEGLGFNYHLLLEIIVFGTVGPLLAFAILELLGRWVDEKDTADLQAQLLTQANEKESQGRQLNDDTIQVLFATSLLMTTIKADGSDLSPATISHIEITEQALSESIKQLADHLLS
jgi:hypothetical protein